MSEAVVIDSSYSGNVPGIQAAIAEFGCARNDRNQGRGGDRCAAEDHAALQHFMSDARGLYSARDSVDRSDFPGCGRHQQPIHRRHGWG